jgi:UDP-glucose 4-epimerase
VVADPRRAAEVLGWTARHDLPDMVASAWEAERALRAATGRPAVTSA